MNIILFSRPIHSGKTTELGAWSSARSDVDGLLMPDLGGQRFFQRIGDGSQWPICGTAAAIPPASEERISVGAYSFSKGAIDRANAALLRTPADLNWLIIDELGKLELRGGGLAPALTNILGSRQRRPANLLLVVRDTLLADMIRVFQMASFRTVQATGEL